VAPPAGTTLLLVIPAPLHEWGGRLWIDLQACNGLRLWLDHFDRVILCAPLAGHGPVPADMVEMLANLPAERLEVHPLPVAFTPLRFARALPSVRRQLLAQIARATHCQFAIGGSWGDWGALATILGARRGRKVAVWTDRVESDVMRFQARGHRGARRLYRRFNAWLAERLERFAIRRAAMGLFHGMDSYRAYARFSPDPHLVHNIHLAAEHRIAPATLEAKVARRDQPLRIVYAGRVHPDKGPEDWIEALARLGDGLPFRATWYGDGPMLDAARRIVSGRGLGDRVCFAGNVTDRCALLAALVDADIFLFCHKTPESARSLIEALLSGTPIVGYASPYAEDLIAAHGGGLLTGHDPAALAIAISALASDRDSLADLARRAAADGHPLVDSAVFAHRAELIKRLGSVGQGPAVSD
jgi:colanic acid/amylovoran biosynthesis glycosyltransferase